MFCWASAWKPSTQIKGRRAAGRTAAEPRPPLSEEDERDIQNLDSLFMRWSNRRQLLILQRALVVNEADIRGIGLRRIKLPPPPGVSQGLRDWMTETGEFLKQGKRLQKLKRLREERLEQELAAKQAGALDLAMPAACSTPKAAPTLRQRRPEHDEQDKQLLMPDSAVAFSA